MGVKVKVTPIDSNQLIIAAGVLIVGVVLYRQAKKAAAAVEEVVTEKLNPASDKNFINQGFTWLYQKIPGTGESLGSDIYDWTHPNENFTTTNPEDLDR